MQRRSSKSCVCASAFRASRNITRPRPPTPPTHTHQLSKFEKYTRKRSCSARGLRAIKKSLWKILRWWRLCFASPKKTNRVREAQPWIPCHRTNGSTPLSCPGWGFKQQTDHSFETRDRECFNPNGSICLGKVLAPESF